MYDQFYPKLFPLGLGVCLVLVADDNVACQVRASVVDDIDREACDGLSACWWSPVFWGWHDAGGWFVDIVELFILCVGNVVVS